MKLIIAVIRPTKLDAVCEALGKTEVTRLTVSDAHDFATQGGQFVPLRGDEPTPLLSKTVLEIVCNDDFVERILDAITSVARTGTEGMPGDGVVFIAPVEQSIQISDGGRGPGAV